jgi:hypothetical protein
MAIGDLEALVGEWKVEAGFPGADEIDARCAFEWILGGALLLQRQTVDYEPAPDSHSLISANREDGGFTQHYFDSRGVVRVYAMTFENGRWTLLRDKPDFSPLDFSQRYIGDLNGDRIDGAWEIKEPGQDWRVDFTLSYVRR